MVVRFVDTDEIVDHHCLNFFFMIRGGDFKVEAKISNHKEESRSCHLTVSIPH